MLSNKFHTYLYVATFLSFLSPPLQANRMDFQALYDSAKQTRSLSMAERALSAAQSTGEVAQLGKVHFLLAYLQEKKLMYYQSLNHYFSALNYYKQAANTPRQIDVLLNVGRIYSKGSFADKALHFFEDGAALAIEIDDKQRQGLLEYHIARLYRLMEKYDTALMKFTRLLPYLESIQNQQLICDSYYELGFIHAVYTKDYDLSEEYYNQGIRVFLTENNAKKRATLVRLYSLGFIESKRGHKDEAKSLFLEALHLMATTNEVARKELYREVFDIHVNLGDIYKETNHIDSAMHMYDLAITTSDLRNFNKVFLEISFELFDYHLADNPGKASTYKKKILDLGQEHSELRLNLQRANDTYQVTAANYKYELEQQLLASRRKYIINVLLYSALILSLIALIGYFYQKERRRVMAARRLLKEVKTHIET